MVVGGQVSRGEGIYHGVISEGMSRGTVPGGCPDYHAGLHVSYSSSDLDTLVNTHRDTQTAFSKQPTELKALRESCRNAAVLDFHMHEGWRRLRGDGWGWK